MGDVGNPTGKHRPKRHHHGEGSVFKRTDRWRAKPWVAVVPYIDPSNRRREMWLSASSRSEADDLRKRELAKARTAIPTEHTVGSYVRGWLMTTELGPWTHDRYRHHIEQRIDPTLGSVPLAELTAPMVRDAMTRWSGAPATRMGAFVVLRTAMRQALADRMLDHDPTENIRAPRPTHSTPDVVDVEDARRLMATVSEDRLGPLLVVSLGLGIRRGECLGLRTADVDLAGATVTIRHSLRRVPVSTRAKGDSWWRLVSPKRDSGRTIPLPAFVAEALRERLDARDREQCEAKVWAPNDFVFSDLHGNPIAFSTLQHWWAGALERAGLTYRKWHSLRASTITILLAEGIPDITVAAIAGHRNLEQTMRYTKLLPRVSRDAANRLDRAIG